MKFRFSFVLCLVFAVGCSGGGVSLREYVYNPQNNLSRVYEDDEVLIRAVLKPKVLVEERNDPNILMVKPIQNYFDEKLHIEFEVMLKDNDTEMEKSPFQSYGNNLSKKVFLNISQSYTPPSFYYQEDSPLNKFTYVYMAVFEDMNLSTIYNRGDNLCLIILDYPYLKNDKIQICFDLKDF